MTKQSKAQRLANALYDGWHGRGSDARILCLEASAELLRLHEVNAELLEALQRIADPRNTHFAGDAQVVARTAIAKATGEQK